MGLEDEFYSGRVNESSGLESLRFYCMSAQDSCGLTSGGIRNY